MTEHKKEHCKPHYKRELSIFEKETSQKIKEFRTARSNWVTADTNHIIKTNTNEGFDKSSIYKGRCVCLRKIGFKTTYLRVHRKSLRPLQYYTCRRKLQDIDLLRTESQEKLLKINVESQNRRRFKRKFFLTKNKDDTFKVKEEEEIEQSCTGVNLQNEPDFFQEDLELKKKSKWKRRKKKREDRWDTKLGLSKRAIEKLRAAQLESGVVESCKCEDGKELTVVIKGFCFCDKNSLNKLNLDKMRDEYSRMTSNIKPALEQKLLPRLTNVSETPEKKTSKTELIKNNEEKRNEKEVILPMHPDKNSSVEPHKNVKEIKEEVKPKDINDSTVTLFKNPHQEKSTLGLTKEQYEKMKDGLKKE